MFNNNSTTYWILLTILIKNPSISLRNNAESNHIHPKRYSSPMKESFPLLYREKKSSMNRNVKTYSISPLLSTLIMIDPIPRCSTNEKQVSNPWWNFCVKWMRKVSLIPPRGEWRKVSGRNRIDLETRPSKRLVAIWRFSFGDDIYRSKDLLDIDWRWTFSGVNLEEGGTLLLTVWSK